MGTILIPFWAQLGVILGPFSAIFGCSARVPLMSLSWHRFLFDVRTQKSWKSELALMRQLTFCIFDGSLLGSILGRFWVGFRRGFGDVFGCMYVPRAYDVLSSF